MSGSDWIGIRTTDATLLKGVNHYGVFLGFAGLILLVGATVASWWREGR